MQLAKSSPAGGKAESGNIFSQYAKYEPAGMRNWNKFVTFQLLQPRILNGRQKLEYLWYL